MNQPVEVCVSSCETYEYETVRAALAEQFRLLKAEEVIRPGMRVAVKPNLVVRSAPEEGAVTHPVVICAVAPCSGSWALPLSSRKAPADRTRPFC